MNGSEKMDEDAEAEEEIDVEEDGAVVDAAVDSVVWRERPSLFGIRGRRHSFTIPPNISTHGTKNKTSSLPQKTFPLQTLCAKRHSKSKSRYQTDVSECPGARSRTIFLLTFLAEWVTAAKLQQLHSARM